MKKSNKAVSKVIHNPTVIYTDNVKDTFEAIRTTDKGVIIGRIIKGEFIECGFISKRNIKKIESGNNKE
jgi:hypothetical protein